MKIWISLEPAGAHRGGRHAFVRGLSQYLIQAGHQVTYDANERDIDVALVSALCLLPALSRLRKRGALVVQRLDGLHYKIPDYKSLNAQSLNAQMKAIYDRADGIIFQSRFSQALCEARFGKAGCKTSIIHNGVDLELFSPHGERAHRDEPVALVANARWRPPKRLQEIIRGFLAYNNREPDSLLVVVGSTELVQPIVVQHPKIMYLGPVPNYDLPPLLRSAHIFLHPDWFDPCPSSVLEAQAVGLPVIHARNGGTPEIVLPGCGKMIPGDPDFDLLTEEVYDFALIPQLEPDLFADMIEESLQNLPELQQNLSRQRWKLDIKIAAQKYLSVFEELLQSRPARREPRWQTVFFIEREDAWMKTRDLLSSASRRIGSWLDDYESFLDAQAQRLSLCDAGYFAHRCLKEDLREAAQKNAKGVLLDVGCGDKKYLPLFAPSVENYFGVDRPMNKRGRVDLYGDAHHLPIAAESLDVVLSTQVLEHLPEPVMAVSEFRRVLKQDGVLILTAPLIFYQHGVMDYYRWTSSGLKHLLSSCGLTILSLKPQVSSAITLLEMTNRYLLFFLWPELRSRGRFGKLLGVAFKPVLYLVAICLNLLGLVLTRLLPQNYDLTMNYIAIAQKSGAKDAALAGSAFWRKAL
jgi:glycosyltransferase involved in cell wall biosynthesis/SAM-dependent methyltransferase